MTLSSNPSQPPDLIFSTWPETILFPKRLTLVCHSLATISSLFSFLFLVIMQTNSRWCKISAIAPLFSPRPALKVLITLLCLTLCDSISCSPPGSSAHGILQTRILEWVAIPFSRRSSWSKGQTRVSCIACGFFTICATGKPISSFNYKQKQTNKQKPLISITILKMSRSLHHCFYIATSWQIYIHSKCSLKLCPCLQPSSWMFLGKKNHIFEKLIIICDF